MPHFKGIISGNLDIEAQGRDSTFTFCHAQMKKVILLHKMAIVCVHIQIINVYKLLKSIRIIN